MAVAETEQGWQRKDWSWRLATWTANAKAVERGKGVWRERGGLRFMRPVRELRQHFWHFAVEFNNSIVRSAPALLPPLSLLLCLSLSFSRAFPLPFAIFVAVSAFSCIASAALKFMSAAAERATRNATLNAH